MSVQSGATIRQAFIGKLHNMCKLSYDINTANRPCLIYIILQTITPLPHTMQLLKLMLPYEGHCYMNHTNTHNIYSHTHRTRKQTQVDARTHAQRRTHTHTRMHAHNHVPIGYVSMLSTKGNRKIQNKELTSKTHARTHTRAHT